jgi:soluble lytic murein transglycosylase
MHAVLRVADGDIESGKAAWESVESDYAFEQDARDEAERTIALLAAYRHHPQALAMLKALPASALNDDVHEWCARVAIRSGDWLTVSRAIESVEDTSEEPLMWRYWHARALEGVGDITRARALYARLAEERDYYGFLAADRLGVSYSMNNKPLVENPTAAGRLVGIPGIWRAYELLHVDAQTDAQREWNYVLSGMDVQQKRLAAVLAAKWGWHAEAIRLVALIEEFDDLALRFPTPYHDEVMFAAQERDLDPAWIYSVMRRESAFAARAQSASGALGLMQLMPATAALTAQHAGLPTPIGSEVLDVKRNIQLGSAYLREMLDRFGGNEVVATAAYNAGPQRVYQWLPRQGHITPDAWVETIPYYETRDYVKAVLAYRAVYEARLGDKPTSLARRMRTILPAKRAYAHRLSESDCSLRVC